MIAQPPQEPLKPPHEKVECDFFHADFNRRKDPINCEYGGRLTSRPYEAHRYFAWQSCFEQAEVPFKMPATPVPSEGSSFVMKCWTDSSNPYDRANQPSKMVAQFCEARDEVTAVLREYQQEDWDGYLAKPISKASAEDAKRFLQLLQLDVPAPDILPEPSGTIGFQWEKGDDAFIVSFYGGNRIVYAGYFEGMSASQSKERKSTIHGEETLVDEIPEFVRLVLENHFRTTTRVS